MLKDQSEKSLLEILSEDYTKYEHKYGVSVEDDIEYLCKNYKASKYDGYVEIFVPKTDSLLNKLDELYEKYGKQESGEWSYSVKPLINDEKIDGVYISFTKIF